MNNKTAVVVLVALSVLLGFGLLMRHTNAVEQKKKDDAAIAGLQGDVKKTTGELTEQKKVNETLTKTNELVSASLVAKTAEAKALDQKVQATAAELAQTASALTKSQSETKAAQAETKRVESTLTTALSTAKAKADADANVAATRYAALDRAKSEEIAKRDASIKDLQNTRDQLNAKVASLNADIAKLNSTIGTLNTRIAFVEGELKTTKDELQVTKDDKSFLTKELARMQGERTEMERKMNDLAFLKEQISTIKSDQAIGRRVEWMRNGTFMDDRKGATLLVDALKPLPSAKPTTTKGSQLNVEVHRDGTVTIKAPAPAAPKPAEGSVDKSVTVGPNFPAAPAPKKK